MLMTFYCTLYSIVDRQIGHLFGLLHSEAVTGWMFCQSVSTKQAFHFNVVPAITLIYVMSLFFHRLFFSAGRKQQCGSRGPMSPRTVPVWEHD